MFCRGIELRDKLILDIGCGAGVLGQFALAKGARSVVGLEPMLSGSSKSVSKRTIDFEVLPVRIQDFVTQDKFDLIMLYDSINHLDENACIELKYNQFAWAKYLAISLKLYHMLNSRGKVVIADASRRNLFADSGV